MGRQPFKFCPVCGQDRFVQTSEKLFSCQDCQFELYLNPAACVGILIECQDELLLAVRAHDPGAGKLDVPGGFVDFGETAQQALVREVEEELSYVLEATPTYWGSYPNVYPFGSMTYRTLDLIFHIELPEKPTFQPADDVESVVWLSKSAIDLEQVAFASIRTVLEDFIAREKACP